MSGAIPLTTPMRPLGVALNKFTFLHLFFTTYVGVFILEFCWGNKYVF